MRISQNFACLLISHVFLRCQKRVFFFQPNYLFLFVFLIECSLFWIPKILYDLPFSRYKEFDTCVCGWNPKCWILKVFFFRFRMKFSVCLWCSSYGFWDKRVNWSQKRPMPKMISGTFFFGLNLICACFLPIEFLQKR